MRKSLLLLPLITLSPFAHADLAGVWKGTLGQSPITACFNPQPGNGASYYYQRFLTPIQLTQKQAGEPWIEEGKTGFWQLEAPQGDTLTGTWSKSQGSQPIPLHLERIGTPSNAGGCASDAYNAALEAVPPTAKVEKKTFQEHPYQVKTQGAQVTLTLEGDAPAIAKVNKDLARLAIGPEGQKDFYQERRNALDQNGGTATSEILVEPVYWSSQWITVRFYSWTAGDGRNGISWGLHTWNLQTGESVDPWSWVGGRYEWHDPYSGDITLPATFSTWLAKQTTPDEGCEGVTRYSNFDLTFDTQGMKLSTPATGDGCDYELSFTWEQLQPVLTAKGNAALPSLKTP
ncbi:hypothetical protein HX890_10270 [Pseudomonas gingeri]|uniref:hypothetical protein n=1 Tax=Pseudomonas gingeri TaxID=117681 RepID=UPI0015A1FE09|nr:hypothetical protein [Pseudomonas gingeri]NWD74492.1 hypothetical protein [Pseudomonas gingeri]